MTDKQKKIAMNRQKGVVRCQGCGEVLSQEGDLSGIEYVKTKRNCEWFFHTECFENVWRRKIC